MMTNSHPKRIYFDLTNPQPLIDWIQSRPEGKWAILVSAPPAEGADETQVIIDMHINLLGH